MGHLDHIYVLKSIIFRPHNWLISSLIVKWTVHFGTGKITCLYSKCFQFSLVIGELKQFIKGFLLHSHFVFETHQSSRYENVHVFNSYNITAWLAERSQNKQTKTLARVFVVRIKDLYLCSFVFLVVIRVSFVISQGEEEPAAFFLIIRDTI